LSYQETQEAIKQLRSINLAGRNLKMMRDLKLNSSSDEIYGKKETRDGQYRSHSHARHSPVKSARDLGNMHNQEESMQSMEISKNSQMIIDMSHDQRIELGSHGHTEDTFSMPLQNQDSYEIKSRKILAQSSLMQLNVHNYDLK
jgi:hypothetical protein